MGADRFSAAVAELSRPHRDVRSLTAPLLDVVPVTGASVSTMGDVLSVESVETSDSVIARIDEMQFDMLEGPCWDAVRSGEPVLESDVADSRREWPAFLPAARSEKTVRALFAFPVSIGSLRLGAVDFYHTEPMSLDDEVVERLLTLAQLLGRRVLERAASLAGEEITRGESGHSRRLVHQATGFVIAQLGVSAADAALLIQAHAFARGMPMIEVSRGIIERRISFTVSDQRIEGSA